MIRSIFYGLAMAALALPPAPNTARAQDTTTVHTLSLGDAARLAAAQNASARSARERTAQASARSHQAMTAFLPSVGIAASVREFTANSATELRFPPSPGAAAFNSLLPPAGILFPPIKDYELQGRIQDTLFSFGAILRYRSSRTTLTAFGADADNAAQLAGAAAANAYLTVQRATAVVDARIADSTLAADLLDIAQQQFAAGVGIQLDVTRAQAQLATTRAQLISARNDVDRNGLDLLRALGLPLESRVALTDSLSRLPIDLPVARETDALDVALRMRPDLRTAALRLQAARQSVAASRAAYLPTLSAFGQDGSSAGTLHHVLPTYSWGLGVIIPVFDGFSVIGRVQENQAIARELEIQQRDLQQQAAIEVRSAYLNLASAREQVTAIREQLRLTEQQLSEARERFRAGVASNADVITASVALNNARTLAIDALSTFQTARVGLARATGTITSLP
jgi:outer membrane protein